LVFAVFEESTKIVRDMRFPVGMASEAFRTGCSTGAFSDQVEPPGRQSECSGAMLVMLSSA